MSRTVLVTMDSLARSESALEYALEAYPRASIVVVHVTESNDPLGVFGDPEPAAYVVPDCEVAADVGPRPVRTFDRAQRHRAQHVLARACEIAAAHDREIEPVVRSGSAVEEILTCARQRDVDDVVVGAHRRTGLRPTLRSTAETVVRKADRPVTVVP